MTTAKTSVSRRSDLIASPERLLWPDLAKGFCLILVTTYHTVSGILRAGVGGIDPSFPMGFDWDLGKAFRVAVFFVISGYFTQRSMARRSRPDLAVAVVRSLLYPYLLWTTVQVVALVCFSSFVNTPLRWETLPHNILCGWREYWFLSTLVEVTLLDLGLRFLFKTHLPRIAIGGVLLALAFAFPALQTFALFNLMKYYFYFTAGMALCEWNPTFSRPTLWKLFTAGFSTEIVLYLLGCRLGSPYFPLSSFCGITWCLALCMLAKETPLIKPIQWLGSKSLQWFCLHVMCATAMRGILVHFLGCTDWVILIILTLSASLVLPGLISIWTDKHCPWLFRMPSRAKKPAEATAQQPKLQPSFSKAQSAAPAARSSPVASPD